MKYSVEYTEKAVTSIEAMGTVSYPLGGASSVQYTGALP